jgi:hypothetical protein
MNMEMMPLVLQGDIWLLSPHMVREIVLFVHMVEV